MSIRCRRPSPFVRERSRGIDAARSFRFHRALLVLTLFSRRKIKCYVDVPVLFIIIAIITTITTITTAKS